MIQITDRGVTRTILSIEEQRQLDAFIAEKETCDDLLDRPYSEGDNAGSRAAAAIRQGNWTREEYQEYLRRRGEGGA